MSLDKKAILKEIEVLIRSIKVHYDNIENEHRIPTIELELITSKIRKLHEKSIIYNHLHYMEEEQLQSIKRMKLDNIIFKRASEEHLSDKIAIEPKKSEAFTSQHKFEEEVETLEKDVETVQAITEVKPTVEVPGIIKTAEVKIETPNETSFKQIKLSSKIGINDRFRFIKNLFGGNGNAMEEAIKEIENCTQAQALNDCLARLKQRNNWNEEDENVLDFLQLVK